jgi:hypothetical protein
MVHTQKQPQNCVNNWSPSSYRPTFPANTYPHPTHNLQTHPHTIYKHTHTQSTNTPTHNLPTHPHTIYQHTHTHTSLHTHTQKSVPLIVIFEDKTKSRLEHSDVATLLSLYLLCLWHYILFELLFLSSGEIKSSSSNADDAACHSVSQCTYRYYLTGTHSPALKRTLWRQPGLRYPIFTVLNCDISAFRPGTSYFQH